MAQEKLISLNNLSTFKDNVDVLLNNKDSYGVCNTAANVAAKTVSHSTFVLTNGVSISVKFVNSNTAENPTLNVNNTGAKAIYRFGTTKPGITEATSWTAGSIVTLTYDGTNWIMNDVQEAEEYEEITYQQWLNMTPAERAASNYFIPDYPSMSFDAGDISYDNTTSGLTGNNVQSAIDEVKGLIDEGGSQVQSDWTEDDTTSKAYIQHKPTLGSAASKDVPTSGNASTTEVVMGSDTRLSDARNAADVYSWAKAETKPSYTAAEVGAIATTAKGANGGVAELDSTGKVPSSQLPSYVDDVLEYNSLSDFPLTGETGKIYIAKDTNKTYRWSGTAYAEISESLALGETSSTAYAGNKGKANADAISAIKDGTSIDSFSDVESALSNKVDKVSGKGLSTNDYTTTEKNKLSGIATGAEVNQNAFSKVTVGSTTIAANSKTDIFNIVAGSNITLTPDATNKKLTMAATDTKYTAATAAPGNIASSGAVGTSTNYARQDHTHGIAVATGDSAGQVKVAGQNVSVNGFGNKQDKTDNSLTTTSKTVVGAINEVKSGLNNIQNQSGEVASGIIDGGETVDVQLPAGVAAYLLCTYRDNDYFATLYYLTYKVGDKITCTPIVSSSNITVTGDLSERHITITNGSDYPCCYAIKNLAHVTN